jgi:hypothetical protein
MEHAVNEKNKKVARALFLFRVPPRSARAFNFFLFFSLPRESAAIETNPPLISGLLR